MFQARVLLASATLAAGNGGIARVGRMTARTLIEAGYHVSMLSLMDKELIEIAGQPVQLSHNNRIAFLTRRTAMMLTHSHVIYDIAGLGRFTPLGLNRPTAVWIHGEEVWDKLSLGAKKVIERADLVFVNSKFTLERYEHMHGSLPHANVCWLSTETDTTSLSSDFADLPTVMMLGRVDAGEAGKGHVEIIDCWPKVVAQVPKAQLIIVGKGANLEALKARAEAGAAAANIIFTGFVPEEEIDNVWRKAWVMALPSRQEGFGLVYVEAMSRGIPAIASTLDAGAEVNEDGVSGFNVDLANSDKLVACIVHLLSERKLCKRMGTAGLNRWRAHFQYSHFRERFLDTITPWFAEAAD